MVLLNDLVRHLRLSERIQEQDYADVIERWMVSELSKPGRQEFLTAGQYARIVARLSDQDARYQARRRAIVMAWEKSKSNPRNELRNDAAAKAHAPWGPKSLVVQRDISIATAHLLDRLESSVPMPITYPGELDSIELGDLPTRGMLWYRPWETQAKQLSKALKSTPKTKGSNDE